MGKRQATLAASSGTVVLAGCVAAALLGLGSRVIPSGEAPADASRTTSGSSATTQVASANLMLPVRVASASLVPPPETSSAVAAAVGPVRLPEPQTRSEERRVGKQ